MASFNFISAFSHFFVCGIGRAIFGTQGDGSLVIMEAKKRGDFSPRFCYVSVKICCFSSKFFLQRPPKNSVFIRLYRTFVLLLRPQGVTRFSQPPKTCFRVRREVLITHSSILLTIPVAVPDSVCACSCRLPIVDRCHSFLLAASATGSARKRPLLLSYIRTSPICKIKDFEWVPRTLLLGTLVIKNSLLYKFVLKARVKQGDLCFIIFLFRTSLIMI